jgi:hypothetical protein
MWSEKIGDWVEEPLVPERSDEVPQPLQRVQAAEQRPELHPALLSGSGQNTSAAGGARYPIYAPGRIMSVVLDGTCGLRYPAAMSLPNRYLLGLIAALVSPAALVAQSADSGTFVIRRSGDTVATERFTRTATVLEGTLAIHNAKSTSQVYRAVIAPDATLPLIEVTVREDADSGRTKGHLVQRARVIFKEDSAAVDDINGRGLQTRIFGTRRGAIPYLNLSFALLEQAVRRSRAGAAPPEQVAFFNLGGGQTVDGKVASLGSDSLSVAIGTVEFHLRVAPDGRVLGGRIPAQNVVVDRIGGSY